MLPGRGRQLLHLEASAEADASSVTPASYSGAVLVVPLSWVHQVSGSVTLNRRPVMLSGVIRTNASFFPACQGKR